MRHGATAALREVLRHHALAAAVVAPVADEDKATAAAAALQANTAWLQDCAIRLLCMFALDRCASLSRATRTM